MAGMNSAKHATRCDRELEALVLQVALLRGEDVMAQTIARASLLSSTRLAPIAQRRASLKAELRAVLNAEP